MTTLLRTKTIISECEKVTENSILSNTPIESYIVQHALVVLCAEIQQEIYSIVRHRTQLLNDQQMARFINEVASRVLRSVEKGELAGFAKNFGLEEKDKFNRLVDDKIVTTYNNAVSNRHNIAHKTGVQVTFTELKNAVSAAQEVLGAFSKAIHNEDIKGS